MMNKALLGFAVCLAILIITASMSGCKEGPAGIQGPAGKDATAAQSCGFGQEYFMRCHGGDVDTVYYVRGRKLQWDNSGHKTMGDFDENRTPCSGCHTTEGFVQRMNGKTVSDVYDPTPVGCFACHSPHTRGDFTLRTTASVTLYSNIIGVSDATFDDGEANLCAQCHQPRTVSTSTQLDISKQSLSDTMTITTNRWYGHHGLQALLLKGSTASGSGGGGGYEWPNGGYLYRNSAHSTLANAKQLACPDCHMADASPTATNAGKVGGHTMNIAFTDPETHSETFNFRACNTAINGSTCHSSGASISGELEHNGKVKAVEDSLAVLYNLLVAKGWIDDVDTSSTYGLVKLTNGKLKIAPASRAGALWNYFFLVEDRSTGIHNSQYALDLLTASLAEIRKP